MHNVAVHFSIFDCHMPLIVMILFMFCHFSCDLLSTIQGKIFSQQLKCNPYFEEVETFCVCVCVSLCVHTICVGYLTASPGLESGVHKNNVFVFFVVIFHNVVKVLLANMQALTKGQDSAHLRST